MLSRSLRKVTKNALQQQRRAYTPSIKFVYGDRKAIELEMANRPARQPWMVDHSASPAPAKKAVEQVTSRHEGKPIKHGPLTTKVTHMESEWFGNPFLSKATVQQQFDDKAINLINMGGAI
jgi:hypothetical protein